jgi:hypothetical protein
VKVLRDKIGSSVFDFALKEALIGVEHGFTQPDAIRALCDAPNSEVRVPSGAVTIATPGMRGPTFFHPKAYVFESEGGEMVIATGSVNLTHAGLLQNEENLFVWRGASTDPVASAFQDWWEGTWRAATVADRNFVDEYAERRPTLSAPEISQSVPSEGPVGETLWAAQSLWVELVRKPEGGSLNQVELLLSAHHFFYPGVAEPPKDMPRTLSFVDDLGERFDNPNRSIRYNGPPLRKTGNGMWRIYFPTATEGMKGYQDGDVFIRFDRTGTEDEYRVSIADSRSPEANDWINASTGVASKDGVRPRRMGWMIST